MKIGFIGNGWRTHGYWRVMKQMPGEFEISGVLFRDPEKAALFEAENPGLAYTDIDTFLAQKHDMVFILIPSAALPPYIEKVLAAGFPLMIETPPARSLASLYPIWELEKKYSGRIQVAEQYFLQPYHQAVRTLTDRGLLGTVCNVRINFAHDYHGVSLMRRLLGESSKGCTITGQKFGFQALQHCGHGGLIPNSETIVNESRKVASFVFDDGKVGFFDFSSQQYYNYFRSRHVNVQGTHGEIYDYDVSYWNGSVPVSTTMVRQDLGKNSNMEGLYHRAILFNGEYIYTSPFARDTELRLTDDEIAMAGMLRGMQKLITDGTDIYPLREALEDTYLWLMMDEAIRTGAPVRTEPQPWQQ